MKLDMSDDRTTVVTPKKKVETIVSQTLWIDPDEERMKEAMKLKFSMETQELAAENVSNAIDFSENLSAAMEVPVHRVFMLSSKSDTKQIEKAERAVEALGGDVSKAEFFDQAITHMISARVNRSEKMLGCIAAGKWVLHPSYLDDSLAAGIWLQE